MGEPITERPSNSRCLKQTKVDNSNNNNNINNNNNNKRPADTQHCAFKLGNSNLHQGLLMKPTPRVTVTPKPNLDNVPS